MPLEGSFFTSNQSTLFRDRGVTIAPWPLTEMKSRGREQKVRIMGDDVFFYWLF